MYLFINRIDERGIPTKRKSHLESVNSFMIFSRLQLVFLDIEH